MSAHTRLPVVSVIIAAYNRSASLHYAVASVLAQSFRDFELLVVGDCCTDDSGSVVRSFGDPRVIWQNLPQNSGNQFAPNNCGLALARGRHVAYLGQDDLWHADHLKTLLAAIEESEADLVFSLTLDVGPPDMPTRSVVGLCPDGTYEWSLWAPPSSWLHRRDLIDRIGPWRDYQAILMPTDAEFLNRAFEHGIRIAPVPALTVFKFTSVTRTNSYVNDKGSEQAAWWRRMQADPELRYRELLAAFMGAARRHPDMALRMSLPSRIGRGTLTDAYRTRRGLPHAPRRVGEGAVPLYADRATLRHLNAVPDIAPADDHKVLHAAGDLPVDGLFLGTNWHSLESEGDLRWRWMDRNAEIVVTHPSGSKRALIVDLSPGPGLGGALGHLQLRDSAGALIAESEVTEVGPVSLALAVAPGSGAIFRLDTEDGGRLVRGDPRVLNFRVIGLRWADESDGADAGAEMHAPAQGEESAPPADAPTMRRKEASVNPPRLYALSNDARGRDMIVTPTPKLAIINVAGTLAYLGLAVLGWGGIFAFFAHPARIAVTVILLALSVAAMFTAGNLSPGEREDRGNRWVLVAFAVLGLLAAWLPAYTDRREIWTIDGDTVRWLGVVLFAAGGALRLWPVFVLGRRFSGLVAIQPGHTLVTDGIYRVIRNPSYLGLLVSSLGWALAFRSLAGVVLAALMLLPLVARMRAEERLLREQFGEEYEGYRARTWRMIPGVY